MSTILEHETMRTEVQADHVSLLRDVVSIESYSGYETNVANYLVESMKQMGFDNAYVDDAGNAVGKRAAPNSDGRIDRTIVLLGHMDTVKGQIEVREEDGKLYGRGTVDAKGPLVTFIAATSVAQIPAGTEIVVIGAVEEESSTSKGARHAATKFTPDLCIIGEPSGWDGVTIGYKGILQVNYLLERPMGHASGLQSDVPEQAIEFWNNIRNYVKSYNDGREKLFDLLIPAIRDFNFYSDGLYDRVKFHASIRLPMNFDYESFAQWVNELDSSAYVRTYGYEVAYRSNRSNALSKTFNRVIRSRGEQPKFKVKTGTCDMNVVGPIWNCPIVAYGPGDSSLDHTPNEHIMIDEYLTAIDVLTEVLEAV
ncbi:MAG: [LysW]-lysine hydrolase [Planctomycetota bacterium]